MDTVTELRLVVTVDDYDGSMHFYPVQTDEPILRVWMQLYPSLFTPLDQAPAGLVSHFRYVVADVSTRLDGATRLVCNLSETVLLVAHTDVASLWSSARVLQYLGETGGRERVRLVLNRFRKIAGFSEADAEAAAGAKLLWKIPNQYFAVSAAIDRGIPLMQQNHTEIARSFTGLASALTQNDDEVKRSTWSLFKTV